MRTLDLIRDRGSCFARAAGAPRSVLVGACPPHHAPRKYVAGGFQADARSEYGRWDAHRAVPPPRHASSANSCAVVGCILSGEAKSFASRPTIDAIIASFQRGHMLQISATLAKTRVRVPLNKLHVAWPGDAGLAWAAVTLNAERALR